MDERSSLRWLRSDVCCGGFGRLRGWLVVWLAGTLLSLAAAGTPRDGVVPRPFVSAVFGDNMVLQRDRTNLFWGWTKPGAEVRVQIEQRTARGVADATGRWAVKIVPPTDHDECTVKVDGLEHVEFRHVLVGSIWICVGPPSTRNHKTGPAVGGPEMALVDRAKIRFFLVDSSQPTGLVGKWIVCPPQASFEESGVCEAAFALACRAQAETGGAVGLVQDLSANAPLEEWLGEPSGERGTATQAIELGLARTRGMIVPHAVDRSAPVEGVDEADW